MIPIQKDTTTVTFYVDARTQFGKKADPLTVVCNKSVFKIPAGQIGICHAPENFSYFGVTEADFKNGSFGRMKFS
jgi:hypothetical protein